MRVLAQVTAWAWGEMALPPDVTGLIEREREVLDLLAEGLDNATSAEALCVTTKTVAYHVANILSKLNVASRLEAVVWMHKHLPDDLVKLPG